MYRFILMLSVLLIIGNTAFSQEEDWTLFKKREVKKMDSVFIKDSAKELDFSQQAGTVNLHQSSKIDSISRRIGKHPFIIGYTVQIEVSQQTSVIKNARYKFLKEFPDAPLNDDYNPPNTYLYAGRFYDKNSAIEFKHQIRPYFPNAIVLKKKMSLPPLTPQIKKDDEE